jgi:FAD/FMN-containing dehydrogenase
LLLKVEALIQPFVFQYIKEKKGSISAEHGIGRQKTKYLNFSKSEEMIEYMQKIKDLFDPNAILNPYKVLP